MSALYDSPEASNSEVDNHDSENRIKRATVTEDLPEATGGYTPQHYYGYKTPSEKAKKAGNPDNVEEDALTLRVRAFQSQGPEVLQTRKEIRRYRKKLRKAKNKLRHNKKGGEGFLPYPDDYKR